MPEEIRQGFRLSPLQGEVWRLGQESFPCRAEGILQLDGPLDPDRLHSALTALVQRHEIFRTRPRRLKGMSEPLLVIDDQGGFEFERKEAEDSFCWQDALQTPCEPFGEDGSPFRFTLFSVNPERHLLLCRISALSADRTTLALVCRQVADLYQAADGSPLPAPELQYLDVSEWLHEVLESSETEPGRLYWQKLLASIGHCAGLPFEKPSVSEDGFHLHSLEVPISPQQWAEFQSAARELETTVGDCLLACWLIQLSRLAATEQTAVGVAFDGRKYDELQQVAGLLTRYLPILPEVTESLSWSELVRSLAGHRSEAAQWQEFFSKDQAESLPPFLFDMEDEPPPVLQRGEITFSPLRGQAFAEPFQLRLSGHLRPDGLSLAFHYDGNSLSAEAVSILSQQYLHLLADSVRHPEKQIGDLEMIPEGQRLQLLKEFAGTATSHRSQDCVHQLIAKQSKNRPEAIAISWDGGEMSFGELEERSNRLARHLQRQGVGPEVRVGICLDRSPHTLVAILAVLKAGGAHVPLDPAYPVRRLEWMTAHCKAGLVLTLPGLAPGLNSTRQVFLDQIDSQSNGRPHPRSAARLGNAAYVIYTSGSTGRPKGCVISHESLLNYLSFAADRYQCAGRTFAFFTSPSFDLSVTSLLGPLLGGGSLHVFSQQQEVHQTLARLFGPSSGIDIVKLTPSHITLLGKLGLKETGLKTLIAGGEELTDKQVGTLRSLNPDLQLFNEYGPTEATVGCIVHEVGAEQGQIPIGKPIANCAAILLDRRGRLVALGQCGEICLAGKGLARGYLDDPRTSAEKFAPHPFAEGERIYKSGDLGRWTLDGTMHFLRRIDSQVKIRGHRVEPAEVEAALSSHPLLSECAVIPQPDQEQLLAFFVPCADATLDSGELRRFLSELLPDPLIPGSFQRLDELPLTANGKLDRSALQAKRKKEYVAARNPLEARLVALWEEVLGKERIGVKDSFFELGGHSLSAAIVVSRLHKEMNTRLEIRQLFSSPTIEDLARILSETEQSSYQPIQPLERQDDYPLSFFQERLWLAEQIADRSAGNHIPGACLVEGELEGRVLKQALDALLARHESLRTIFVNVGGHPRQRILTPAETRFQIEEIELDGMLDIDATLRRMANAESAVRFELATGPLLRFKWIRLGEKRHAWLFSIHHIISDGWSITVLLNDLVRLYDAFAAGQPDPLEPLQIQYKEYAAWHTRTIEDPEIAPVRDYWLAKLSPELPVLDLPADFDRSQAHGFAGKAVGFQIEARLLEALGQRARDSQATPFMALLACLKILLYRYTGQEDIIVGTPAAGRLQPELENQIGLYLHTLALRDTIGGEDRFAEVLERVKQTALDAFSNQIYPLDRIRRELKIPHDPGRNPIFQIGFTLQNQFETGLWEQPRHFSLIERSRFEVEDYSLGANTDLWFVAEEKQGGLEIHVIYNSRLFRAQTVEGMLEDFARVVEQAAADPQIRISQIALGEARLTPAPAAISIDLEL